MMLSADPPHGLFPGEQFPVGPMFWGQVLEDVNGDALPDLITPNFNDDSVSVLLGQGDGSFAPQQVYAVESKPFRLLLGDLDKTHGPDIVVSNVDSNSVSVLLNQGDGTFAAQTSWQVGPGPWVGALGDINGDDVLDIVTANSGSPDDYSVSVLIGTGDGTFAAQQKYAVGEDPWEVVIAEINGDHAVDIVTLNNLDSTVSILLNDGGGGFFEHLSQQVGNSPEFFLIEDLDNDGSRDIITVNSGDDSISVLRNAGGGLFDEPVSYAVGEGPSRLALGDLDGDQLLDVATANGQANTLSVLLNAGDGSLLAAVDYAVGNNVIAVSMADVDGDNAADVIATFNDPGEVAVFPGNADGTLSLPYIYEIGFEPALPSLGYLNDDSHLDLVVVGGFSELAIVLMGNGDGSFAARRDYAVAAEPNSIAVGDVDGDDRQDIIAMHSTTNQVTILQGSDAGTFGVGAVLGVGQTPQSGVVADLNGDAIGDLAMADAGGAMSVLLSRGDGAFGSLVSYDLAVNVSDIQGAHSLAVGNFNGDAALDVVVAVQGQHALYWFPGKGDGSFADAISLDGGLRASFVRAADINVDGHTDLVTNGNDGITVLLGGGDATFAAGQTSAAGGRPAALAVGDVNADGWPDVVAVVEGEGLAKVMLGDGSGLFATSSALAVGDNPITDLSLVDTTGDAHLDIVASRASDNGSVAVLLGLGGGVFSDYAVYNVPGGPRSLAMADLDADGVFDLVTGNDDDPSVAVLPGLSRASLSGPRVIGSSLAEGDTIAEGELVYEVQFDRELAAEGLGAEDVSLVKRNTGQVIHPVAFEYDPSTLTATVNFAYLFGGAYELTLLSAADAFRSVSGQLLDGESNGELPSGNGQPGGRFQVHFDVPSPNPHGLFPTQAFPVGEFALSVAVGDVNQDGIDDLVAATRQHRIAVLLGVGDGSFGPLTTYAAGSGAEFAALGDLEGDGDLDIVTTNWLGRTVSVLVGRGDGTFSKQAEYDVGSSPQRLSLGDLNQDGVMDIAVPNEGDNTVSILLSSPNGGYPSHTTYAVGEDPYSTALQDLNGDGRLDLVVANSEDDNLSVLLGMGAGTFASPTDYAVGDDPVSVSVGDLNSDGVPDLVASNNFADSVSVLLGEGEARFAAAVEYDTGFGPWHNTLGDVNGDGSLDIVTADAAGVTVSVLSGRGDGSFEEHAEYVVGSYPLAVALGEFNGDAHPDIAAAIFDSSAVAVLWGRGDGSFPSALVHAIDEQPETLSLADLNGDGRMDLVTGNYDQDSISVILGDSTGVLPPAITYPVGDAPQSLALADLNGDNQLDVIAANNRSDDLSVLLGEGDGTLSAQVIYQVGDGPRAVTTAYLNGDNALDVVVVNSVSSTISLLLGNGDGTLVNQTSMSVGYGVQAVTAGDLDGDNAIDLVVTDGRGDLFILRNDGSAAFTQHVQYDVGSRSESLDLGDVNGDGVLDIVAVTSSGFHLAVVLLGQGDGTFVAAGDYPLGDSPSVVFLRDINGDRKLDIVAMNEWGNSVSLLLGYGDGGFVEQSILGVDYHPQSLALADINSDGFMDIATVNGNTVTILLQTSALSHLPYGSVMGPIDALRLYFNRDMQIASFDPSDDIARFTGPRGILTVDNHQWLDARTLEVSFAPQTMVGTYEIVFGPQILDAQGQAMNLDQDLASGELPDDQYVASFVIEAPRVTSFATRGPADGSLNAFRLTFSHPMDPLSFSWGDDIVAFSGPGGQIVPTGQDWVDPQTLEVSFSPQAAVGVYQLVIAPEIRNTVGNPLNSDGDTLAGELPDDRYLAVFTLPGPRIVGATPHGAQLPPVDSIRLNFDSVMDPTSFSLADDILAFSGPDGAIAPTDFAWIGPQTLEIRFAPQSAYGRYEMLVGPGIFNASGTALDQDGDFLVGEAIDDQFQSEFTLRWSGRIAEDTTWSDGPIVIEGDLTIPAGVTLRIEPGTVVKFADPESRILVGGTLDARGTAASPIVFTSLLDDTAGGDTNRDGAATRPAAADWDAIQFNGANSLGQLDHVEIRYAEKAIYGHAPGARIELGSCVLRDGRFGVYVYTPYVETSVENCLISDNELTGIFVRADSRHVLRNTTIVGNGFEGSGWWGAGVHLGGASLTLENTILAFNHLGIHHFGDPPLLSLRNSDVYNPDGTEIVWDDDPGIPDLSRDGNFSSDPLFVDRAAENFELAAGSPAIDAARGFTAAASDFFGRPRLDDPGVANTGAGYPAYVDLGAFERQQSSPRIDLSVVAVSPPAPSVLARLDDVTIQWTVQNVGVHDLTVDWTDAVYLSSDPYLDPSEDQVLTEVVHSGGLAAGDTYAETWIGPVPSNAAGALYVLVETNAHRDIAEAEFENNLVASDEAIAVDVPELQLGIAASGALAAGEWAMYRFHAQAGIPLTFTLDGDEEAANLLFIRHGLPPTHSSYELLGASFNQPDQLVRLVDPGEGTYYVGVYTWRGSAAATQYDLLVEAPGFSVREIWPTEVGGGPRVSLTIEGDSLRSDALVQLVAPDDSTFVGLTRFIHAGQLQATFDLAAAAPGLYDVVVEIPSVVTTRLEQAVTVSQAAKSDFDFDFFFPEVVRPDRPAEIRVEYGNVGNTDLAAPLLVLVSDRSMRWQVPETGAWVERQVLSVPALATVGDRYVLTAGSRESITLHMRTPFEPGRTNLTLYAAAPPEHWDPLDTPLDWSAISTDLQIPDWDPTLWQQAWSAMVGQVGESWSEVLTMLRGNANLLPSEMGDPYSLPDLFYLELRKTLATMRTSIRGVAATSPGVSLAGRTMTARNGDTNESFVTHLLNDGSFILDRVSAGSYQFTVENMITQSGISLVVAEGEVVSGLVITVDESPPISAVSVWGVIRASENGLPLPAAQVTVSDAAGNSWNTISDEQGQYAIGDLRPETYSILVELEGRASAYRPQVDAPAASQNFSLPLAATIIGAVGLGAGGPIDGELRVAAHVPGTVNLEDTFEAEIEGDNFVIRGLPCGTYELVVIREGYVSRILPGVVVPEAGTTNLGVVQLDWDRASSGLLTGTVVSHAPSIDPTSVVIGLFDEAGLVADSWPLEDASFGFESLQLGTYTIKPINLIDGYADEVQVVVSGPDDIQGITVEVFPGSSITGTVRDRSSNQPLAGVPVLAITPAGDWLAAVSDEAGVYRFDGLSQGAYGVSLPTSGSDGARTVDVTSLAGDVFTAPDLLGSFTSRLTGRVTTHDGLPLPDAVVAVLEDGRTILEAVTDQDGNYELLFARSGNFGLQVAADGASFQAAEKFELETGATVVRNFASGNSSLSLTFADPVGDVAGARVLISYLELESAPLVAFTEVDAEGALHFDNLAPGKYAVDVRGAGSRGAVATAWVAADSTTSLTVFIEQLHHVTGSVTDDLGRPVSGAEVRLLNAATGFIEHIVVSNSDGGYVFAYVSPGAYDLTATADNYETGIRAGVDLDADEIQDIVLGESSTELTGRIVDPSGHPVPLAVVAALDASGRLLGLAQTLFDGAFRLTTVVGDQITIQAQAPGYQLSEQSSLSVPRGAAVAVGDLSMAPVAFPRFSPSQTAQLAQTLARAAARTGETSAFSSAWNWVKSLFQEAEPNPSEVKPENIPDLPSDFTPRLAALRLEAMAALEEQQAAYAEMKKLEKAVDRTSLNHALGGVKETAKWVGAVADTLIGIAGIAKAASTRLASMAALNTDGLLKVAGPFKDVVAGLIDWGKSIMEMVRRPSGSTSWRVVLEEVNTGKSLLDTAQAIAEKYGKLPSNVGWGAASGFGTLIKQLADFEGTLRALNYEETDQWARLVDSATKKYLKAKQEYEEKVAWARNLQQRYQQALKSGRIPDNVPKSFDVYTSYTPEDKFGPLGYDAAPSNSEELQRHIPDDQRLYYRVEFWNKPDAPVPTQDALVEDTLDPALYDLSTFQFTRVGFLQWDQPLAGAQVIDTRIDMRPDANLAVEIEASLNPETGVIRWYFHAVDPYTGDYPLDPMAGFLPPFDPATGYEIGWVEFQVENQAGLSTGTVVANQAFVEFDFAGDLYDHPAPKEGPWINTIDSAGPSSSVTPLPKQTATLSFDVSWSGSDDTSGSGVANFDVYVSEDGGPFTLWLEQTTAMIGVFTGQQGKRYAFYSLAMDNLGNIESPPLTADSQTIVNADHPWHNLIDRLDINNDGMVLPQDVLIVINNINTFGSRALPMPPVPPDGPPPYLDVNADDELSPVDALIIINFLNARAASRLSGPETGESETDESEPDERGAATSLRAVAPMYSDPRGSSWSDSRLSRVPSDDEGAVPSRPIRRRHELAWTERARKFWSSTWREHDAPANRLDDVLDDVMDDLLDNVMDPVLDLRAID